MEKRILNWMSYKEISEKERKRTRKVEKWWKTISRRKERTKERRIPSVKVDRDRINEGQFDSIKES